MLIRIAVTDEMLRAASRFTGTGHGSNPAIVRAVLDIVERDFNDRSPGAWGMPDDDGRSGSGCITVLMEPCELSDDFVDQRTYQGLADEGSGGAEDGG